MHPWLGRPCSSAAVIGTPERKDRRTVNAVFYRKDDSVYKDVRGRLYHFPAALCRGRILTYRRIEIDNSTVERTSRPIALKRKNALFAGDDAGAENRATIATPTAIVNGHKQSRIGQLLQ